MFDAVRNNKRIVQIFLVLITLPFALWGVESYIQGSGRDTDAAEVGGTKISIPQFQEALREQQDRLRQQMGDAFDPEMLKQPEMRESVLNSLINQRLLQLQIVKGRLQSSKQALQDAIVNIDAFKEGGQFSMKRYEMLLAARGMTREGFEAQLARDIAQQQLLTGIAGSAFAPAVSVQHWLALQDEQREVANWTIPAAKFASEVKLAPDAAKKAYEANLKRWEQPEQIRVEYVVLSADALTQDVVVSDQEVRAEYDAHKVKYGAIEERRARHILIEAPKDAPADKRAAAKEKADSLLKQLRAKPDSFAELAKVNSQDPGSAPQGGELGFFSRGMMVGAFDDTAFKLKVGEISHVVETEYGYHIIQVEEVRGGKEKPFDEVKGQIAEELRHAAAARKYAEVADAFSNMVYDQSDTLKPAAEKYKLQIQQSGWIVKGSHAATAPFNNDRLLSALFAADALTNHRNTEAVDVGNNTLVSARVLEHKVAAVTPFADVQARIEHQLREDEADKLAAAEGEKELAKLQKGEVASAEWSATETVLRTNPGKLSLDAIKQIFRADANKLPAYVGVSVPGLGYQLVRISKVEQPVRAADDPRQKGLAQQYSRLYADEDMRAYLSALKERYKVTKSQTAISAKE